jgi:glycosyltransferase involved in cell wall biosynthesis
VIADPPLVSCIMPTKNRREFAARAIDYFRRQDYPNRELVIVDDGDDRIADLARDDERIRYVPLDRRLTLGAKRNLACEHARGSLIVHWDDDDWHASHRLDYQVRTMRETGADVCGTDRLLFYDPGGDRGLEYVYPRGARRWLAGGTLCYRREWWRTHRFDNVQVGEDGAFVAATRTARLVTLRDPTFYVATIHPGNTSPKHTSGSSWRPYPTDSLRQIVGDDWPAFKAGSRTFRLGPSQASARDTSERVTVAIPHYRARPFIVEAVESILAQTYRNLRLVVVNDGDLEPPWDLLAHIDDPRLVTFELAANHGRYFADAVVLDATPDRYFLVQDADDWSDPERLEKLLAALNQTRSVAAVSAGWVHSAGGIRRADNFPGRGQALTPHNVHRVNHIGVFDVAALRSIGGNYAGERLGYDTLIGNLLLMVGRIAYVDLPLYHRRITPGSLSRSPETGLRSKARAEVWPRLHRIYAEAYVAYRQHRSGRLAADQLGARIRAARDARVSASARAELAEAAARLRVVLQQQDRRLGPTEPAPSHHLKPVPDANPVRISGDDRLAWTSWTITPTLARHLEDRLSVARPRRLLELGSGNSTVILAEHARRTGATVTTLEHDPAYLARTVQLLETLDLRSQVDLRLAPIETLKDPVGNRHPWYRTSLDGTYDFVLVDGPPLRIGRDGTLFGVANHLAVSWELWLDDGFREHEQHCLELWQGLLPFEAQLYDIDYKGLWVLRPPGGSAAGDRKPRRTVVSTLPNRAPRMRRPAVTIASATDAGPAAATGSLASGLEAPLVSCLMPTFDRRPFIRHAIALFDRQDYPNRELVVVDDGIDSIDDLIPAGPRFRYLRLDRRRSIGEKRNAACEIARGLFVIGWDDDDWYAPDRITQQVRPLIDGRADAVGLTAGLILDLPTDQYWRWTAALNRRMFEGGLISGTLAFARRLWLDGARFPNASLAEDAEFHRQLVRRGARVEGIANDETFIYVRHGKNSWRFVAGHFLDREGWRQVPRPSFLTGDDVAALGRIRAELAGAPDVATGATRAAQGACRAQGPSGNGNGRSSERRKRACR